MTAAAAQCAADRAGRGVDGAHGDHRLREHGAAGMPNIQAKTGQKAVDLLRYFKKAMAHRNHTSTLPETASFPEALTADSTSLSEIANALVDITITRVRISRQFKKNRFLIGKDIPFCRITRYQGEMRHGISDAAILHKLSNAISFCI